MISALFPPLRYRALSKTLEADKQYSFLFPSTFCFFLDFFSLFATRFTHILRR